LKREELKKVKDERITIQQPEAPDGLRELRWQRISSEQIADCRVFRVRHDRSRSPRDGSEHDFFCIEASDWINVIPLTARNEVVMIEQYRQGTNEITLEIPGGMVDAGEEPRQTAARELYEETGYRPREIVSLGRARPNPAIQNNWIYFYLALNCQFEHAPVFDSTEETRPRLVPLGDVPALIRDGAIDHALVIASFHWLSLFQSKNEHINS
jgi:ADP-ribose pyrophosphatase